MKLEPSKVRLHSTRWVFLELIVLILSSIESATRYAAMNWRHSKNADEQKSYPVPHGVKFYEIALQIWFTDGHQLRFGLWCEGKERKEKEQQLICIQCKLRFSPVFFSAIESNLVRSWSVFNEKANPRQVFVSTRVGFCWLVRFWFVSFSHGNRLMTQRATVAKGAAGAAHLHTKKIVPFRRFRRSIRRWRGSVRGGNVSPSD